MDQGQITNAIGIARTPVQSKQIDELRGPAKGPLGGPIAPCMKQWLRQQAKHLSPDLQALVCLTARMLRRTAA